MNPKYEQFIKKIPSVLKTIGNQLNSSLTSSKEHLSADASDTVINAFSMTGTNLSEDWDYFVYLTESSMRDFIKKVVEVSDSDIFEPMVVCIERVSDEFEHLGVWCGTVGLAQKDYYTYYNFTEVPPSEKQGKVMITEDIERAMSKFVGLIPGPTIPMEGKKMIGDTYDTEVPVGTEDTGEPVNGWAAYTFPINLQTGIQPFEHPSEGLSEGRKLSLTTNFTNLQSTPQKISLFEKYKTKLGDFLLKETELESGDTVYMFENGSLQVPRIFHYDFHLNILPKVLNEGDKQEIEKVYFKDLESLTRLVSDLTNGMVTLNAHR